MKQERRVVKERESSVFMQRQPENLPVRRSREPREIKRQIAPQQPGVQRQNRERNQQQDRSQQQPGGQGQRRESPPMPMK